MDFDREIVNMLQGLGEVLAADDIVHEYFQSWLDFPEDREILIMNEAGVPVRYRATVEQLKADFDAWYDGYKDAYVASFPPKAEVWADVLTIARKFSDQGENP